MKRIMGGKQIRKRFIKTYAIQGHVHAGVNVIKNLICDDFLFGYQKKKRYFVDY